ncbi:PDR/VanB family oxidoreductase [Pseudomonas oryzihabitans]|uniref:Vanillate O-demethylase ferredoxin subunit n=1 Tax=Pseudomonas oryzihabitans TaxID=47885 RepID=A0AAJ2EUF3_9PSED|nr:PDR/VanB family oxidoreductase [Pseudomonas psychrotolerans]MDR6232708.1 vanillate O-demethylase ferredoxin subunit [Pseudomonas psychrotolerans]MDR6358359.1 vanillate O-demethylase ferredoxin subunit [Pseudomonas psychrotolerans]
MLDLIVTAVQREAPSILAFDLTRADGGPLPGFTAGAHLEVTLGDGLIRHYSLCATPEPAPTRYRIAVLLVPESRGGSQAMHRLQLGDQLQVSEPRNLFALVPSARRTQLLAGGIGITPLLAMAEQLHQQVAHFQLRYLVRDREHAAFIPWLKARPYADRVKVHFDQQEPALRPNFQHLLGPAAPDDHLYVCGPAGFMTAVVEAAQAQGWQPGQIHREFFAADPAAQGEQRPFEVELARSGRCVQVPAERSVVQVLADLGIVLPVSCGQGLCGTCVTPVLAGEPEHHDLFLSAAEHAANDRFTPCCSRAKGERLVLDL